MSSDGARPTPIFAWQVVFALSSAAIGGVAAVLPALREEHGLATTTVGIIAGAGFLAAFVGQGLLAPLADRFSRKLVILGGLGVTAAGLVGMAIGANAWQLVLARVAIGAGTGAIVPSVRAAVAGADPVRLAENQGRLVVGEMAGFVVGPALTAILADRFGLDVAFVMLAGALVVFVPVALRLPANPPVTRTSAPESRRRMLARPRLRGTIIMMGGYALGLGTFEAVLPLQLDELGVSTAGIGLFLTTFVVPIALSSVVGGRVADRLGTRRVASVGMLLGSVFFMVLGLPSDLVSLAILLALTGVADGFGFTASLAVASSSVAQDRQATALGMVGAVEVLLAGVGTVPAAWLFDRYGADVAWATMGGAMVLFVAIGIRTIYQDPQLVDQQPPPTDLRV